MLIMWTAISSEREAGLMMCYREFLFYVVLLPKKSEKLAPSGNLG